MNLAAMRLALEALQYRCKPGNDVPESIRPADPHQLFCYRGSIKTTGVGLQVDADETDLVQTINLYIEPGEASFSRSEAARWFAEVATLLLPPSEHATAGDWLKTSVVANRPHAQTHIGGYVITLMCEYDIPNLFMSKSET